MAQLLEFNGVKTYATRANVIKAVEKRFADTNARYVIMTTEDGRFFPLFIGNKSIEAGTHHYFCTAN